jgi:hypothetical protein
MGAPAAQTPGLMPGMPDIDLAVRALPLLGWDGLGIVEARAWSARRPALAQSMPAVRPPGGVWGRTRIWAYFMTASSLLTQWGGTLINGTGTRTVSSLSGAPSAWPCRRSARPGQPPDPQNWHWTSLRGHDDEGGDRRHLRCTSDINHWRRNSSLTSHSPQQVIFLTLIRSRP